MFTLIIEDQDRNIHDEYSFTEGEFIIGRSHSSDIILPSDNVSRRHARLYTQDGRCFIEDLNSSNGLFVDGKRIHRVHEIVRSAQVKVGDYYLHVEGASYGAEPRNSPPAAAGGDSGYTEQSPAPTGLRADDAQAAQGGHEIYGRLVGTNAPTQGRPFDIVQAVTLVGRGRDCAITVIDQSVSRAHAKLVRSPDGNLAVQDLGSSNGVYINDVKLERGRLSHGDRVRFGNVEFICELPTGDEIEVVEVSSGGRKGLLFLVVFLTLLTISAIVLGIIYRDELFGSNETEAPAAESTEDREEREQKAQEEREERLRAERQRLENLVRDARRYAAADRWAEAVRAFTRGANQLERLGRLDATGELGAYFREQEARLRSQHGDYLELVDALEEEKYVEAGAAYQALQEGGGPFVNLSKERVQPIKDRLLAVADGLCAREILDGCVEALNKAKMLDPTDDALKRRVGELQMRIARQRDQPKAPGSE